MGIKLSVAQKAFISCFIFLFSVDAMASEPNADVLKNFMSFELPPGWEVLEVKISNSTNFGTDASPFYKQKFTAKLAPLTPLFKHQKWQGGTEVISLYASKEKPISVNGMASSELKNERWNSEFEFESQPFDSGKPIKSFSSTAVLEGSQEEIELQKKMKLERIAQDQAKADAEARKRASIEAAEAKEREKQIRLQNLMSKYNAYQGVEKLTSHARGKSTDARFPLSPGDEYYVLLDGADSIRTCRGGSNNLYSANGSLVASAINSGALDIGQKSIVKVMVVPHGQKMPNHVANGVTCVKTGKQLVAIKFEKIHDQDYNEI